MRLVTRASDRCRRVAPDQRAQTNVCAASQSRERRARQAKGLARAQTRCQNQWNGNRVVRRRAAPSASLPPAGRATKPASPVRSRHAARLRPRVPARRPGHCPPGGAPARGWLPARGRGARLGRALGPTRAARPDRGPARGRHPRGFSIRARGVRGYISDLLWSRSGSIRLGEVASFPGSKLLFAVGTGAAASWDQRGRRSHQDHDLGGSGDPRRRSASRTNSPTLRPLGTPIRRSGADRALSDAVEITRSSAPPCPSGSQCRRSTCDAGSWRACVRPPRWRAWLRAGGRRPCPTP